MKSSKRSILGIRRGVDRGRRRHRAVRHPPAPPASSSSTQRARCRLQRHDAGAPVGGNPGTTRGEQRLFAFTYAANIWGATLTSATPIRINAQFVALTCTATSAVSGSAGATQVFSDFPGAQKAGTWYSYALANKLAGRGSRSGQPQINARFNVNLGQTNCLAGTPFYLGVDNAAPATTVDFVETLLHEMGHGLGFQTFTSGATGAFFFGQPSIWDHYLHDDAIDKLWVNMTDAERAASSINPRKLSWYGANVTSLARRS